MSYALVEDVPATWEHYGEVARTLGRATRGLLLHVAGPTDEGFRIIEVWESEADWRRVAGDREAALDAIDPHVGRRTAVRQLHPMHVVLGAALELPGSEPEEDER